MKKISLILCCVMLCCVMSPLGVFAAEITDDLDEIMREQETALEAYYAIATLFTYDQDGNPVFPDSYGGAYINETDPSILVVKVVGNDTSFIEQIYEIVPIDSKVQIQNTEYSLNELFEFSEKADAISNDYDISYVSISQKDSLVNIGIVPNKYTDQTANAVVEAILSESTANYELNTTTSSDLPISIFEKDYMSYPDVAETAVENQISRASGTIYGGSALYTSAGNLIGSAGICGAYNGSSAILTAGHVYKDGGSPLYSGSYAMACMTSNYTYGCTGDYAIYSGSNFSMNNYIYTGSGLGTVAYYDSTISVPYGTAVLKYGAVSGRTSGTIADVATSVTYTDGVKVYGLTSVTGTSTVAKDGDSGGPVWTFTSTTSSTRVLLGTVSGRETDLNVMYYSPIAYAYNVGFRPYQMTAYAFS